MRNSVVLLRAVLIATVLTANVAAEEGQDQSSDIAKKLQNPVADLISVPLQSNWDKGFGTTNATKYVLNVQPVIPIGINEDWNVITRTIIPVIDQEAFSEGGDGESGLGDILQSFFFSPKEPTEGGWIWGVGPAILYPSASEDVLGGEKWGLGPTAVFLRQESGFTYGALVNHIWSVGGTDSRSDISASFIQPFLSYTTSSYTTFSLNTESSYNFESADWTIPINAQVSQLLKIGSQPISIGVGPRYYAASPNSGPEWGVRAVLQFIFPK